MIWIREVNKYITNPEAQFITDPDLAHYQEVSKYSVVT